MTPLRLALRALVRTPGYALLSTLTLAAGTGATLLVFSVLNALLLRPLPYDAPESLYALPATSKAPDGTAADVSAGPMEYLAWRGDAQLGRVGAFLARPFSVTGGDLPERIDGGLVAADWFAVLGVTPARGRLFTAEEEFAGARVALIAESLRRRRYPDVEPLDATITLDGTSYTIVGVMPAGFGRELNAGEVWVPLNLTPATMGSPGTRSLFVVARARPGAAADLTAALERTAAELARLHPSSNAGWAARAVPLQSWLVRDERSPALAVGIAVVMLLLLAFVNVTGLTLARSLSRQSEVVLRRALGADAWRASQPLFLEAIVLGAAGAAVGLACAAFALPWVIALYPGDSGLLQTARIDGRTALLAVAAAVIAAASSAGAVALLTTRLRISSALADGTRRASAGRGARRAREVLLATQVALALVLLCGSAAALLSLAELSGRDLGFRAEGLVSVQLALPRSQYRDVASRHAFNVALLDRVRSRPGVERATVVTHLFTPDGSPVTDFIIEGRPSADGAPYGAQLRRIESEYFETVGVPLLRGRRFDDRDREDTEPVVLINRAMAEAFWPDEDPLDARIQRQGGPLPWMRVVGIVADAQDGGPAAGNSPAMYLPFTQSSSPTINLLVRTRGMDPHALRADVWAVDRSLAIDRVVPVLDLMGETLGEQRFRTLLLTQFAIAALLLAAVGIYGVTAHGVAERTREIGIRAALGAQPSGIAILAGGSTLRVLGAGLGGGAVAVVVTAMLARGIGADIALLRPGGILLAVTSLAATALLATVIPAWRAAQLPPVDALSAR